MPMMAPPWRDDPRSPVIDPTSSGASSIEALLAAGADNPVPSP